MKEQLVLVDVYALNGADNTTNQTSPAVRIFLDEGTAAVSRHVSEVVNRFGNDEHMAAARYAAGEPMSIVSRRYQEFESLLIAVALDLDSMIIK